MTIKKKKKKVGRIHDAKKVLRSRVTGSNELLLRGARAICRHSLYAVA